MNLTGTWVGTTREDDLSYHWRVTQRDDSVFIYATFNDQTVAVYYYSGTIDRWCLAHQRLHTPGCGGDVGCAIFRAAKMGR